jgi:hypothetical protein
LPAAAGGYRSRNFVVTAAQPEFAKQVCLAAEHYRKTLAVAWLGRELPDWHQPCPITVRTSPQLGAGGVTSFMFEGDRPFGWRMAIQGSAERILDSVLPHEVTHTIFATHFGCPLPRWADEGACTTVEHESEKAKHYQHLYRYLTVDNRGIPFNQMFRMTEYPPDIMPLYAQGHSVVEYLIAHGGRRRFVDFLAGGMRTHDWNHAVKTWYPFDDLSDLQIRWVDWLRQGRPEVAPINNDVQLAGVRGSDQPRAMEQASAQPSAVAPLVRAQDPGAVPNGSWYARRRDRARERMASAESSAVPFQPGSIRGQIADRDFRSTTRPHSPTQATPAVVEWGEEGYWTSPSTRR